MDIFTKSVELSVLGFYLSCWYSAYRHYLFQANYRSISTEILMFELPTLAFDKGMCLVTPSSLDGYQTFRSCCFGSMQ